jgi:hypothetical protein
MAQHRLKIILAAGGLALAITAGGSDDARAFTETTVPPAQPQTSQPAPAPQLQLQKPEAGDGLSLVKPGDSNAGGTELRIPGIGSVGTVPKLDFGLDLLYGAGSDPVQQERPQDADGKDVTIKGTLRHRF